MSRHDYEYLLPVFVGHPFSAPYTELLRQTIQRVCDSTNAAQSAAGKRFLWVPRFINRLDHGIPTNVLDTIRDAIRQSAVTIFDITDLSNPNVFLELGLSIGMGRAVVLTGRKPFNPPSDLRGLRGIEYTDADDLHRSLSDFFDARVRELRQPPPPGQDLIHQKMQIDAVWEDRFRGVEKGLRVFAGDVSWVHSLSEPLRDAIGSGVGVHVCCQRPAAEETVKWENIEKLKGLGAQVKSYAPGVDPRLRGFLTEPQDLSEQTVVLMVEKETRVGGRVDYARTGVTVGESEYFYKGSFFRANTHQRITCALVRLFESVWKDSSPC